MPQFRSDQLLAFQLIHDQLDEIHNSITSDLIKGIGSKFERDMRELRTGESRQFQTKVDVINVGKSSPSPQIEQLSRLKSIIESIGATIDHMKEVSRPGNLQE